MSADDITGIDLQEWNDLPGKKRISPRLVTEWLFDSGLIIEVVRRPLFLPSPCLTHTYIHVHGR